jgi:membrane fusion protein (multidrug efflux system)
MNLRIPVSLILCALLVGCGGKASDKPAGAAPATVTTTVLAPAAWNDQIAAIGTARANESVTMTAKVNETIQKVDFDSGNYVKAGQVLVTLSNQANVAGLAEASANYRDAEQLFERQQGLVAQKLIAASTLDAQRAARDAAKARMDAARAALSDRVITAPFDGVLGLRQVSEGSLVTPGSVIATLDDVSRIKLDFTMPDRYLPQLHAGQTVIARSDAYPNRAFEGAIASLDSRIDPVSRAITVRAEIPNPDRALRPGMQLDVAVQLSARQALQVPELALLQVGQQAFVFRVGADGAAKQVPVTIGARKPGIVEIVDGVASGDRVVVEGTVKLHDGSKVVEAGADAQPDRNASSKARPKG